MQPLLHPAPPAATHATSLMPLVLLAVALVLAVLIGAWVAARR